MELDEIKKLWNEIDLLKEKQQISQNKIKEMLKNKGETALAKLVKRSKIDTYVIIPSGLILCLCSFKFFQAGGYYIILPLIYLLICIVSTPLGIYWYRFIKEVDLARMSVKEVSDKILKYQNYVKKSQVYVTIFSFVYSVIFLYLIYKLYFGSKIIWGLIIFYIILCLSIFVTIPFSLKKMYYSHIDQIKESLQELKEFEEL